MALSPVQQQAVDLRGKNIVVSASAGSGKTHVLTQRLLKLITEDKIPVDRILAMTFTNDAAAELKSRLKRGLAEQPDSPWVRNQLALLEDAAISTIDSFCSSLLRQYYYKLNIPLKMASTLISPSKQKQALEAAYQKAIDALPVEDYSQLRLYMQAYKQSDEDLQALLLRYMDIVNAQPDPDAYIESTLAEDAKRWQPWFTDYFKDRAEALKEIAVSMYEQIQDFEFAKIADRDKNFALLESKINGLDAALDELKEKGYPAFREAFRRYVSATKRLPSTINKHSFQDEKDDYQRIEKQITDQIFSQEIFDEDAVRIAKLKRTFSLLAQNTRWFYQEEKRRLEVIDYSDMEHFAYQILQEPEISEEVRSRFEYILVDEFQDTNNLQENIIKSFARKDNVFRVGDPKQSIYGFRQARPQIMKEHMINGQSEVLAMDENYRSTDTIIDFNNKFYEELMNNDYLEPQFDAIDIAHPGTEAQKEDAIQHPVRFLYTEAYPWAAEHGEKKPQAGKIHRRNKVDLIANDILKKVRDNNRRLSYRSITILTRTHSSHQEIREGLAAWGIPAIAEIDHGFYTNQAVQIISAALRVLVNPFDDIALTAFLCSPLGKVSHKALAAQAAHRDRGQPLFISLRDSKLLDSLHEIEELKNKPLPEILRALYNRENFYFRSTTAQDKTNLDLLLEMAVEQAREMNLAEFTAWLEREAKLDKTAEAARYGREADVVKIRTMHHAKGLQDPLVYVWSQSDKHNPEAGAPILLDPDLGPAFAGIDETFKLRRPSREQLALKTKKHKEELAEEMRLFYVATTRAEQELVIVDAVTALEQYKGPLGPRAFLSGAFYTDWVLRTCKQGECHGLIMDKGEVYKRPDKNEQNFYIGALPQYDSVAHPELTLASRTASSAKEKLSWGPIRLEENKALAYGTLIHELAETCPYPYQAEDLNREAQKRGAALSPADIRMIQKLNKNKDYAAWMEAKHQFECSYVTLDREGSEDLVTHGFMDLVVWLPERTVILDFKTDTVKDMVALKKRYAPQMSVYRDAMLKIAPDKPVETWIYSFHLGKLSEVEFDD